jgi:hypothetical protein
MAPVTPPDTNEPEDRHRGCWYGRRTSQLPPALTIHTIEDGELLYCAHPMFFPIVGYDFDVRNCTGCDAYKPRRSNPSVR